MGPVQVHGGEVRAWMAGVVSGPRLLCLRVALKFSFSVFCFLLPVLGVWLIPVGTHQWEVLSPQEPVPASVAHLEGGLVQLLLPTPLENIK